ncbi:lanthionine synthetase LanC family protein [Promicromonospora sp. NPDC057138]|uniref:lanthionine synthetase LanC family protein n=1 Tax=Promicromonospora sp. NPDC057138 TaxID=3346031 RepID=UPI00362580A0
MNATVPAAHLDPWVPGPRSGQPLSLADGALGEALLEVELALTGVERWDKMFKVYSPKSLRARDLRGDGAIPEGLFYGAPAAAFVLDAAGADGAARYVNVLNELDKVVDAVARERLTAAQHRRKAQVAATADEFDLFNGLIGLGVLLLRRAPHSHTLSQILTHLVDLTQDRTLDGVRVPGWWSRPDVLAPHYGHAELGMARGAAGLLALLALAVRAGRQAAVPQGAFESLVGWLDDWRQDGPNGSWWPQRLTLDELRTGRTTQTEPTAPTWAGTVGIARALQMAAIVTGKTDWRTTAETVMATSLSPQSLGRLTDPGLLTGTAGVYQTAFRAAQDASSFLLKQRLSTAAEALARTGRGWAENTAFLTGRSGTRLANQTLLGRLEPASGWDRLLVIAWTHS